MSFNETGDLMVRRRTDGESNKQRAGPCPREVQLQLRKGKKKKKPQWSRRAHRGEAGTDGAGRRPGDGAPRAFPRRASHALFPPRDAWGVRAMHSLTSAAPPHARLFSYVWNRLWHDAAPAQRWTGSFARSRSQQRHCPGPGVCPPLAALTTYCLLVTICPPVCALFQRKAPTIQLRHRLVLNFVCTVAVKSNFQTHA